MDAQTLLALELIGYYLAACILSSTLGNVLIAALLRILTSPNNTPPKHRRLASTMGSIERIMYISAFLIGKPEFIAVWLLVKVAGDWGTRRTESHDAKKQQDEPGVWVGISPEYMIFLIGNLLSIMLAVGLAILLQGLLPPLPTLKHWGLPT